jgi:hypothetical protein
MLLVRPHLDRMADLVDVESVRLDRCVCDGARDLLVAAEAGIFVCEPTTSSADYKGYDGGRCDLAPDSARAQRDILEPQPVRHRFLDHALPLGADRSCLRAPSGNPARRLGIGREPGLDRYWVPSIASSALHRTAIADHWFDVHTGGDLAFLVGVLRAPGFYVVEEGRTRRATFAVNVTDPDVSNLARSAAGATSALTASAGGPRPWWLYCAVAAFAAILLEWWTWLRRITV